MVHLEIPTIRNPTNLRQAGLDCFRIPPELRSGRCFTVIPVSYRSVRKKTFPSDSKGNTLRTGAVADPGGGVQGHVPPIKGLWKNVEIINCIRFFLSKILKTK